MSFLGRQCISLNLNRLSLCEINGLKYIFKEMRSGIIKNEKCLTTTQSRFLATENIKDSESKVPELKTEHIYYGPLTNQVRSVKIVTIASSIVGLFSQPMLYNKIQELGVTAPIIAIGTFYGLFVLVSPYLVHLVTKRYVTDVEYNEKSESYTAYTYTFFLRRKKIEFTPDDVKIPTMSGIFTTIVVKGSPLFLDPKMFNEPRHYSKIMGYDKPIDFSLESDLKDEKK